jgi:CHAT domain-containing protein
MIPSRHHPGEPDEERDEPLGVEFDVGRWVDSEAKSPPPTLPIKNSFLIAPRYTEQNNVLDPTIELEVLERYFAGEKLEKATYEYLEEYLKDHSASLLHFVCHGAGLDKDTTIYLDDGVQCTSAQLRVNKGMKAACAAQKPVVFLNACEGGQLTKTLGPGGAGFPVAFTELGARAIIAPLWPVAKGAAPLVAKAIYETAVANPDRPLAEVLAELRGRSYKVQPFEDSWAAYCLFGDPRSKLQRI